MLRASLHERCRFRTMAAVSMEAPPELGGRVNLLHAEAGRGRGAALFLEGSGTSPSLEAAGDFLVLQATAAEAEAELPYAVLADLLRPVLHLLDSIPQPQAEALRSAFALGPAGDDRLALCAGTLSLLAAAAPVLVA